MRGGRAKVSALGGWVLGGVLLFGIAWTFHLIIHGDANTVRMLSARVAARATTQDEKIVNLKDALNEVVSVFPELSEEAVPQCVRRKLLDARRLLQSAACDEEEKEGNTKKADVPTRNSKKREEAAAEEEEEEEEEEVEKQHQKPRKGHRKREDDDDADGGRRHGKKKSHEVILNGEERSFIKMLLRLPTAKLSKSQLEALEAVRGASPRLYSRLEREVKEEALKNPVGVVPAGGRAKQSSAPAPEWSGTSLLGGRGLRGWKREFEFDPQSDSNDAIFVALVTFRDPQCPDSLVEAFARASKPSRVRIGVVQQNRASDLDCFETYCHKAGKDCRPSQVRVLRIKDTEAQGVMMARFLASTLWSGERWYLQIDAHSGFQYAWDDLAIRSTLATGYERTVLSHHPPDMRLWPSGMGDNVINICKYKWDDANLPRFSSIMANKKMQHITKPFPGIFIGAGFVFGRSQWIVDCPFDPHLTYLFSGEELLLSVCLFTKGWNIYNPDVLPVWHYYTRNLAGRENPSVPHLRTKAVLRLKYLFGVIKANEVPRDYLKDLEPFLMGNVRTREQYWKYAGIDWEARPVNEPFCNMIDYSNEALVKERFPHHFETLPGLPPLKDYFFDTVPTVAPRYKSTAAPMEQYLNEKPDSKPHLAIAREEVQH